MQQADSDSAKDAIDAIDAQLVAQKGRHPRRRGSQRALWVCLSVVGAMALLGLTGCPADLEDPQRFNVATAGAGDSMAGGGATVPGLNVDTTCLVQAFAASCATATICHKAGTPAAGLDLETAGVNRRLIDVVAPHTDALPATGCVAGQKLIDSATPAASWLTLKLGDGVTCGSKMPIGPITDANLACIKKYIDDVGVAAKAGM